MKTEKLELAHLAAYLPYGLQIHVPGHGNYKLDGYSVEIGILLDTIEFGANAIPNTWKPLLRPLSELTETITFNGESFVPINKLKGLNGWDYLWEDVNKDKQPFNIFALKYASIVKMLEWHFDIHNLIPSGLALPLTIQNNS